MKLKVLNEELPNGYRPFTTFYTDLGIAEYFGTDAVKSTFKEVFKEWYYEYKYLTEFVMCLNFKCWEHYESGNNELCDLYSDLYYKGYDWCLDHFEGKAKEYFFKVMD